MQQDKARQRFSIAREIRLSIALIVILSLLAGMLFTYVTKIIGARIEHGFFSFIAVFLGYVIIVIVLAHFFTYRFIGPFERLKMEMRLILAGNYDRRLCVRGNDDFYIRSFILDVNKLLAMFEGKCIDKNKFKQGIDTELIQLISLIAKEEVPREKIREAILAFHDKVESILKNNTNL